MKEIKLTPLRNGKVAIVDDEDYDELNKYKWYFHDNYRGNVYALRVVSKGKKGEAKKTQFWMHRVIMNTPKEMITDHINGDGLDNRKENLRICTIEENSRNRRLNKKSTSSYKGVYWDKQRNKWKVYIISNKKRIFLGRFNSIKDAGLSYNEAAKKYHCEFANINNITI